jgi:hypothetical protein
LCLQWHVVPDDDGICTSDHVIQICIRVAQVPRDSGSAVDDVFLDDGFCISLRSRAPVDDGDVGLTYVMISLMTSPCTSVNRRWMPLW